jgi:hypothetical protein
MTEERRIEDALGAESEAAIHSVLLSPLTEADTRHAETIIGKMTISRGVEATTGMTGMKGVAREEEKGVLIRDETRATGSRTSALNVTKRVIMPESVLRAGTIEIEGTKGEMTEAMTAIAGGTTD